MTAGLNAGAARLGGKVAIVTGAASGIGRAIAEAFLVHGANVLGVDLPGREPETTIRRGAELQAFGIDITETDAPARIVKAALDRFGRLDILVNNAGVTTMGSIDTLSDEAWRKVMSINVDAPFRLTREAVPHLVKSPAGRVINLGSILSDAAGPGQIAYTASKHAVAGMSKAMAIDLGKHKVTVNYLQPGSIQTPLIAEFVTQEGFVDYWRQKTPLGRLGEPEEVAAAAVFLASEEASYISGAGLRVDGGAFASI